MTLYVTGDFLVDQGGTVQTDAIDSEKLAVYMVGDGTARFSDGGSFFGVVYGPSAKVKVDNGGTFAGAFVAGEAIVKNQSTVFYDESLHRNVCSEDPPELVLPSAADIEPGKELNVPALLDEALAGYSVRVGGRTVPLTADVAGALATLPPDLKPGTEVEFTLVDPNGCRLMRTRMMRVEDAVAPPACGLLGSEFLLALPLARILARPRRRPHARRRPASIATPVASSRARPGSGAA